MREKLQGRERERERRNLRDVNREKEEWLKKREVMSARVEEKWLSCRI